MDSVECIVIGAGAVGLAVAARLAQAGREVIVLEQHDVIGSETSSRNSEVIHAGIYYRKIVSKQHFACAAKKCFTSTVSSMRCRINNAERLLWPPMNHSAT